MILNQFPLVSININMVRISRNESWWSFIRILKFFKMFYCGSMSSHIVLIFYNENLDKLSDVSKF